MAALTSPAAEAAALVAAAYAAAAAEGALPAGLPPPAPAEVPRDPAHGDWASAFALASARAAGKRPREVAGILLAHMDLTGSGFASAEVAGGGFLNFRLGDGWYAAVLSAVEREGPRWGRSAALAGRWVLVMAAPRSGSPLEDLRAEATADALAALLAAQGAGVRRCAGEAEKFSHAICVRAPGSAQAPVPPGTETLTVGPVRASDRDAVPPSQLQTGALLELASPDALRWYLTAGPSRPLRLDADLAAREDWASPFYRVRYACRRCAVLAARDGETAALPEGEAARALLRCLARLPDAADRAVRTMDPGHVSCWLTELADGFYRLGAGDGAAREDAGRARLLRAVGTGLENGLALLGIGK